ncbi:MAG: DUF342 domain-containing protein [Candidatus Kapabacteria bacterium]|nr:DUF342 domain-containing protein [Candidatus Kapabacteria bacterium]
MTYIREPDYASGIGRKPLHGRTYDSWNAPRNTVTRYLSLCSRQDVLCQNDVHVNGSIENCTLYVRGSLYCEGDVRNSTLVVEGHVRIDGDCAGSHIICHGESAFNRLHSTAVFSAGTLFIKRYATDAHVESAGAVIADHARLCGSLVSAGGSVTAARMICNTSVQAADPFLAHYWKQKTDDDIDRTRHSLRSIEEILASFAEQNPSCEYEHVLMYHHEQISMEDTLRDLYEPDTFSPQRNDIAVTIGKFSDDSTIVRIAGELCPAVPPDVGATGYPYIITGTQTHVHHTRQPQKP